MIAPIGLRMLFCMPSLCNAGLASAIPEYHLPCAAVGGVDCSSQPRAAASAWEGRGTMHCRAATTPDAYVAHPTQPCNQLCAHPTQPCNQLCAHPTQPCNQLCAHHQCFLRQDSAPEAPSEMQLQALRTSCSARVARFTRHTSCPYSLLLLQVCRNAKHRCCSLLHCRHRCCSLRPSVRTHFGAVCGRTNRSTMAAMQLHARAHCMTRCSLASASAGA